MAPTVAHRQASLALAELDPVMAALVDRHGPMRVPPPAARRRRFENLAESIAYQQLAGQAAATIWGRFRALYGPGPLDPEAVLATPTESLRAAGLSGAKAAAIVDLARHVDDGTLELDRAGPPARRARSSAQLVQVRGIGPLDGPHVPDLHPAAASTSGPPATTASGPATAWPTAWPTPPTASASSTSLGERFRPYRSVAAWYCWRALESPGRP